MRILDHYLLMELFKTFLAVLSVLLLITFGSEATQLLAMAVEGKMPSGIVFQVLLLKIPPALEIILPLVALLSVMLTMGRLYQDQEMVVMTSCGISPRYFQKLLLVFLLPLALFTAWISLFVTPWSFQVERQIISEAKSISPVAAVSPGRFNPLSQKGDVFYTKSISENGRLEEVWVQQRNSEQDLILMAPYGWFEWVDERMVLVLENGVSYQGLHLSQQGKPITNAYDQKVVVQQFNRMEVLIPELQSTVTTHASKFEVESYALWQSDQLTHVALLQWRLVTPLGIIVLGLIGLRLSKTGPREGRFAKLFIALVVYIVYNQLLVLGRDGIESGGWPSVIGLWPIPVFFLLYALLDLKEWKQKRLSSKSGLMVAAPVMPVEESKS